MFQVTFTYVRDVLVFFICMFVSPVFSCLLRTRKVYCKKTLVKNWFKIEECCLFVIMYYYAYEFFRNQWWQFDLSREQCRFQSEIVHRTISCWVDIRFKFSCARSSGFVPSPAFAIFPKNFQEEKGWSLILLDFFFHWKLFKKFFFQLRNFFFLWICAQKIPWFTFLRKLGPKTFSKFSFLWKSSIFFSWFTFYRKFGPENLQDCFFMKNWPKKFPWFFLWKMD